MQISTSVSNILKSASTVNDAVKIYGDIYLVIVHEDEEEEKKGDLHLVNIRRFTFLFLFVATKFACSIIKCLSGANTQYTEHGKCYFLSVLDD